MRILEIAYVPSDDPLFRRTCLFYLYNFSRFYFSVEEIAHLLFKCTCILYPYNSKMEYACPPT